MFTACPLGAGDSVHRTAQYERLTQDPSDNEEEEDDILFLQDGRSARQNGFHGKPARSPVTNGQTTPHDDSVEMSELGIQKAKIRPASEVEVRVLKRARLTKTRAACFIATLIMAVCVVIGLVIILPQYRKMASHRAYNQTAERNASYPEFGGLDIFARDW